MSKPKITNKARLEFVRRMLTTNVKWQVRALVAIWNFQTADEQSLEGTVEHNGVGFNSVDGDILTSFGNQVARGRTLSAKQMAIVDRKIRKYARQILKISDQDKLDRMITHAN